MTIIDHQPSMREVLLEGQPTVSVRNCVGCTSCKINGQWITVMTSCEEVQVDKVAILLIAYLIITISRDWSIRASINCCFYGVRVGSDDKNDENGGASRFGHANAHSATSLPNACDSRSNLGHCSDDPTLDIIDVNLKSIRDRFVFQFVILWCVKSNNKVGRW